MSDPMVDALLKSEAVLKGLQDNDVIMLALSEVLAEMAMDNKAPPGLRAKRMALAGSLASRAGVKF
jgi:hypothetical protein